MRVPALASLRSVFGSPAKLHSPDTMSETQEVLPGNTLKRITEEHRYMGEFVDWLKCRLELDKKYIEELKALRTTANPQWSQSSLSPLVSSALDFISQEVKTRQATCDTMTTYLEELSNFDSPDSIKETGGSIIDQYDELIAACKTHELCRDGASSMKAVRDMQQWHERGPNGIKGKPINAMGHRDFDRFVLPESERNYRESVVRQQALTHLVNTWHHSQFPERLDYHQSHYEEIKALLIRMTSEHSRLLTALVGHLETTKNSVHESSSSLFISWAHDQCQSESEHEYMKEVMHVDFSNGTTRPYIIFGTVSQSPLVERVVKLLKERTQLYHLGHTKPTKDRALKLEQSSATRSGVQLELLSNDELRLLYSFAMLSNPPLIPLIDQEIKRYASQY